MASDELVYHRLTDSKRREVLDRLSEALGRNGRIELAYVFGSFTRRSSVRDIDVAIYAVPPLSLREQVGLMAELELDLGMSVDIVQIQKVDPAFRLSILRKGLPLVVRSTDLRNGLISQAFTELRDHEMAMNRLSELKSVPT